jgi:hypothetical protein
MAVETRLLQFLRDYGTHFTVNRMLSFDSVKLRLEREQPMTFLEFNYMLMQATDFLELNRKLRLPAADGRLGPVGQYHQRRRTDPKGGPEGRLRLDHPPAVDRLWQKMGKTVGGAVWLNADALSPYDYWQYWRNTEDGDVARFMRLFTDLSDDAIAGYEALEGAAINDAKKALADAATTMLHGADEAAKARAAAETAFEKGQISADLPTIELPADEVYGAMIAAVVTKAGLTGLERRGPPPGPGRRPAPERRPCVRRRPAADPGRPQGRRDQAGGGQEEDRAGSPRLTPPHLTSAALDPTYWLAKELGPGFRRDDRSLKCPLPKANPPPPSISRPTAAAGSPSPP